MSTEAKEYIEGFPKDHIFAPNSRLHGNKIYTSKSGDKLTNAKIEVERMRDFIEYIFENHIDWMSQNEAWEEFDEHEVDTFILNNEEE